MEQKQNRDERTMNDRDDNLSQVKQRWERRNCRSEIEREKSENKS